MRQSLRWTIILSLPLLIVSPTGAFIPLAQQNQPAGGPAQGVTESIPLPVDAWTDFLSRYPGSWKIDWDAGRGSPRAIYGASLEISPGGLLPESLLEERILSFVDANRELFGAGAADLAPLGMNLRGRLFYANFQQVAGGAPVYGGHLQVRLRRDGSIVAISSKIYRGATESQAPAVPAERASMTAKQDAFFAAETDIAMEPVLVLYPHVVSGEWQFPTAWLVELVTRETPGHWFYMIDASSGTITAPTESCLPKRFPQAYASHG